jgi:hypothetical protein
LINLIQNGLKIADRVGVKRETHNHPYRSEGFLVQSDSGDIAISHRGERLERPVHRRDVLVQHGAIEQALANDPT